MLFKLHHINPCDNDCMKCLQFRNTIRKMLGLAQKVQSSKKIGVEAKKMEVRKPGVFLLFFPIDTFIIIYYLHRSVVLIREVLSEISI